MPFGFEVSDLPFPLARRLVRDLRSVVAPAILNVPHARQKLSSSRSIAAQLVGSDHVRHVAQTLEQLAEEALSRPLVSALVHQDVEDIAVLIDCAPQVTTLAIDADEDFV